MQSSIFVPKHLRELQHFFSTAISKSNPSSKAKHEDNRVADYLRRARFIDAVRVRLRSAASQLPSTTTTTPIDSFTAAALIRSAPSTDSALSIFNSLPSPSLSHSSAFHSLARRLSISRRLIDLQELINGNPYKFSLMDKLRFFSAAGDVDSAVSIFSSICTTGRSCTEAYNLLLSLYALNGNHLSAVSLFSRLLNNGALPNSRTYSIVIQHLVSCGKIEAALQVFDKLPVMRIKRTTKQYNVLAEAFASAERFDDLKKLVRQMGADGLLPGRSVREAMVAMRDAGHFEGIEDYLSELQPDSRIGYAVGAEEEESCSENEEEQEEKSENFDKSQIKLKPWLDPGALARALDDWDSREVSELEAAGFVWTSRLVCKLLRAFRNPETAWKFFCWVAYQPGGFTHDKHTVSRMIAVLARNGKAELVDRLLAKVKLEGILLPFATIRLVVDLYGLSKNADAAMKVYHNADSVCGPISPSNRLVLCSSMLRTLTKCKKGNEAIEFLEDLMLDGFFLDIQTFSGLMQYFASENDLKTVHRLFGMVKQCGLDPDAYMYRVLIWAYCRYKRAALALRMFDEMMSLKMAPDIATERVLVKSLWKEGKLGEAALVQEKCEEVEGGLPAALPGHVWTVSSTDFQKVLQIYLSSFTCAGG